MKIPFNKPYSTGKELQYISEVISSGQTAGNGPLTRRCQEILLSDFGLINVLLTSSCSDALEMAALLLNIKTGDEVIVPSYTFVSTALAFSRQGAKIVFADSRPDNPCIDENKIEKLITSKTRAVVPVHYSGIACDMDRIMDIATRYKLWVIEDAAHAFGAKYKGKLLGTIGHLGCFSFHETKIIHCGEGGMLSVNDDRFSKRAEIIWEKGTDRAAFHRGEVQKYEWIDTGSSFLMSDISAGFLFSQIKEIKKVIIRRKTQWELYYDSLKDLEDPKFIRLPKIPAYSQTNYSGFYFTVINKNESEKLRKYLISKGIQAITHYLDLSRSPYILNSNSGEYYNNPNSLKYQDTLIRLPLFQDLSDQEIKEITDYIKVFYNYGYERG